VTVGLLVRITSKVAKTPSKHGSQTNEPGTGAMTARQAMRRRAIRGAFVSVRRTIDESMAKEQIHDGFREDCLTRRGADAPDAS
jgi:hypothetical protein